eukprot:4852901-Pyramimonas_sp.AAC.2
MQEARVYSHDGPIGYLEGVANLPVIRGAGLLVVLPGVEVRSRLRLKGVNADSKGDNASPLVTYPQSLASSKRRRVCVAPYDDRGVNVDGRGVTVDDRGVNVDGRGVTVDDRGVNVDGRGVTADDRGVNVDGRGVHIDGRGVSVDGRPYLLSLRATLPLSGAFPPSSAAALDRAAVGGWGRSSGS